MSLLEKKQAIRIRLGYSGIADDIADQIKKIPEKREAVDVVFVDGKLKVVYQGAT
jgi:hypothetical protein